MTTDINFDDLIKQYTLLEVMLKDKLLQVQRNKDYLLKLNSNFDTKK